ncbi:hypothetical protein [Brachybacterium huguangmaarense]
MSAPPEPPPGPYSQQSPFPPSQAGPAGGAPSRKRWPLFAALGCGCLLLLGLAVVVLVVGLSVISGGDGTSTGSPTATATGPSDRSSGPASDPSAGGAPSQADQDAARGRFHDFLQAASASDFEGACAMTLDPDSDQPLTGAALDACAENLAGLDAQTLENLSLVEPEDITFEVLSDGTLDVYVRGERFEGVMTEHEGQWYLAKPDL